MPEFGALKGFPGSLPTLENHRKTSLEEVTRRIKKWFGGPRPGNQERTLLGRDYWGSSDVLFGQTGIVKIHLYCKGKVYKRKSGTPQF